MGPDATTRSLACIPSRKTERVNVQGRGSLIRYNFLRPEGPTGGPYRVPLEGWRAKGATRRAKLEGVPRGPMGAGAQGRRKRPKAH